MKRQDTVCECVFWNVKERKLSIVGVAGERKYCGEEKLVPINIALLLIVGECRTKHRWIVKDEL